MCFYPGPTDIHTFILYIFTFLEMNLNTFFLVSIGYIEVTLVTDYTLHVFCAVDSFNILFLGVSFKILDWKSNVFRSFDTPVKLSLTHLRLNNDIL